MNVCTLEDHHQPHFQTICSHVWSTNHNHWSQLNWMCKWCFVQRHWIHHSTFQVQHNHSFILVCCSTRISSTNYTYHLCVNRNVFNEIGKSTCNNICKCQQNIQFHIEFHNVVQCNCCQLFISNQTTTNVPTIVTNHSSTTKYNCFMCIEQETIIHRKHRSNNCHSCCNDFQHIIHCDIQW